jgi:hypothetical protein
MAAVERDPQTGLIQFNGLSTGPRRYGPEMSTTATSGTLPSAGYQQRTRNQALQGVIRARLQAMLANGQATPEQAQRLGGIG